MSRSCCVPSAHALQARALLAVADGRSYTEVPTLVGRQTGDTVRACVSRFNREGMAAVRPRHGGGPRIRYGEEQHRHILSHTWPR